MKAILSVLVMALLVFSVIPFVAAVDVGSGITPDIGTEDFVPRIWMCDDRAVVDDMVERGRMDCGSVYDKDGNLKGYKLCERMNNYAFTGEKIEYEVLVMDKNGINKIEDVYMTAGDAQGEGNDIEANCVELLNHDREIEDSCNARIDEEYITEFDEQIMRYYECTFTVEPDMYDEYWVTAEVTDLDGEMATVDENEFWFFNPVIQLTVEGDLTFSDVRPGTDSYSDTILVGNDADVGSGVRLDMFVTGTDFYDSSSSGAACPTTNQLSLGAFSYFATHGAYSTATDLGVDDGDLTPVVRGTDAEGYVNIQYGDSFSTLLYDEAEILQTLPKNFAYYQSNILSPGAEIALTFKLSLPVPCNGDFDSGEIIFWGEAI